MIPSFNTAGPCIPGEHYLLSPEKRFRHVARLVDEGKYFALRAGRQTGKRPVGCNDSSTRGSEHVSVCVDLHTANGQPDPAVASPAKGPNEQPHGP